VKKTLEMLWQVQLKNQQDLSKFSKSQRLLMEFPELSPIPVDEEDSEDSD